MPTSYTLDSLINNSPSTNKETYKSDVFLAGVVEKIRTFFENDLFCDVTLKSKDDEYQVNAHKMVLSAASAYFLGMFGGSLKEASGKEVNFPEVDGHSLKMVINYIYTASIEFTIDTVEEIVKTAHLFELESLKELCCDFIAKQLEPCNCVGIALFADQYNLNRLYRISEDYVCDNFDKIRNNKEFFDLDVDHLKNFLSNNELRVESEEAVFECLMSWVEYDKENREKCIETLLHCVRLPLVRPLFIVNVIEPACICIESERLLYKAMKWHQIPEIRASLFAEKFIQPRPLTQTLIAIMELTGDSFSVGYFNFGLNEWTYKPCPAPTTRRRGDFGTTLLNGKLIIAGGTSRVNYYQPYTNVDCLDLNTLEWTVLTPMQSSRYNFGMVTLEESMYVFGGFDNNSHYNSRVAASMEKYDPITENWSYVSAPNMDYCSTEFNLIKLQKKLCAQVKKRTGHAVYHIYDPSADSWQMNWWTCTSAPLGAGTVISNQKEEFFIAVSRNSIYKINLQDDSRETIEIDPPLSDEFTQCSMFGDQVIIFGERKFKVYYPFTNSWRIIQDLINVSGRVVLVSNF